jgi:nucleotide-binding universal stress UspA family protein
VRLLKLETVLAATDLEPSSDSALVSAARLADAAGAKLHVAHVSPQGNADSSAGQERMAAAIERAGVSGRKHRVHLLSGSIAPALVAASDEVGADVIVLGRHRAGARSRSDDPIGSTAYEIMTHTLAPCLVTARPLEVPIRRAVVAIDTSETARGALLVALSWSSALRQSKSAEVDTTLIALHVEKDGTLSPADAHMKRTIDHELDVLKRGAGSGAGVSVEGETENSDDTVAAIINFATSHKADLVVLGTRGLSAHQTSELGSVAAAVTRQLPIPVLVVPPAVWRSHTRDIDYF